MWNSAGSPATVGLREAVDKLAKESLGLDVETLLGIDHADLKPQVNAYVKQLMQIKWNVEVHWRDLY